MKKLLIATKNIWKATEIAEVIWNLWYEILNLNDLNCDEDVEENWETYEANAKIKAEFFWNKYKIPTIADDSWIQVEALSWELWIKTRRWWAWENATDKEWLDYFLERMDREDNRNADFYSSICFYDWNEFTFFNWMCKGILLREKKCESLKWIPISSIFIPEWYDKVYSMLSVNEKNLVSHRGKASVKLREYLLALN